MSFRKFVTLTLYFIIAVAIGLLLLKNLDFDIQIFKDNQTSVLSEVKERIEVVVKEVLDTKSTVNTKVDSEIVKITKDSSDPHAYFVADGYKNSFRVMLQNGQYQKLNRELEILDKNASKNILKEDRLFIAYESFEIKNAAYETLLNYWVIATPDHYQPYLARASYYYAMAWSSRGYKYMSRTSDKSVNKMYDYIKLAMKDISVVMTKNKEIIVPHSLLIGMSGMGGGDKELKKVINQALQIKPLSYEVRLRYLNFITPRWGGSFKKMAAFIDDSEKYISENSRLEALSGLVYSETGEVQKLKKNYAKAEELFSEALSLSENHDTLFERGITRDYLKKYEAAIADFSRAIEIYSEKSRYYYWRARSYNALEKYDKAAVDIKKAYSLDPFDSYVHSHMKWMANRLTNMAYQLNSNQQFKQAISKYSLALELSPGNAENYDRRSRAYIGLHKLDKALDDIKTAIRLNPYEIRYYLMADYLLAKSKKWDEIIDYWNAFIKLKPGNGRAYLERGGSYYRKGNIQAAIADAKKSSELGNIGGQEMYQQIKHRTQ